MAKIKQPFTKVRSYKSGATGNKNSFHILYIIHKYNKRDSVFVEYEIASLRSQ